MGAADARGLAAVNIRKTNLERTHPAMGRRWSLSADLMEPEV